MNLSKMMKSNLAEDASQLAEKNISQKQFEEYLYYLQNGFPFVKLFAPCAIGNGILSPAENELEAYIVEYDSSDKEILKFVPASGAASRMFKHLQTFINTEELTEDVEVIFRKLSEFAFYPQLLQKLNKTEEEDIEFQKADYLIIARAILAEGGLHLANKPKGLIPFHKYADGEQRTAFEEHLAEGALYANKNGVVKIHFTVSPEAKNEIELHLENVLKKYEQKYNCRFAISYSEQKPATDTPAVDLLNVPIRDENGEIIFRPGGHGALLENLNDLDADVIFIKNIDNVVPDALKEPTVRYKKALGGYLLQIQAKIFTYLQELEQGVDDSKLIEIIEFCKNRLFIDVNSESKKEEIVALLNRPLRICGMVKNEGEPGGGPFWVEEDTGRISLQIVETAQIDLSDETQLGILKKSSHFNPVDLVCATKNYKGEKFNLMDFRNMNTGFIAEKSLNGKPLKALELPGLWNGAMYNWNTIFVEVPVETFNPVKTVNDLLRNSHQA